MNQNKLSIRFVINKAKMNKRGLCPISCRLTFKLKRKAFSTGEFINPSEWNSKKQQAVKRTSSNENLNLQLELILNKIRKAYLQLQLTGQEFNVKDILKTYLGKPIDKEYGLVQYFGKFLHMKEALIGKDIQYVTWKKYHYVYLQVRDFIKWKFGKKDILLKNLRGHFIDDFEYYLKTERKQVQITINKSLQRFRKPIKTAVSEGFLKKDPFALHVPGRVKREVVFLSSEELEKLEKYTFTQPRLELVKDLFVFCCYTGLAYREMSDLKREHIVKGFDGNQWIKMIRRKTDKLISVPLLPQAKLILGKYESEGEDALPKFSNQKINSYLKEIADILAIDKPISHHMARKTFASTVLLYNDVPMEIVSELLGHSSMKITQEYYGKVVQKRVSQEILRLMGK